jgi:hypothetical protein
MGLKLFINSILTHAEAIPVSGGTFHVDIWNNQVQFMRDQTIEAIPLPALFVEVLFSDGGHDAERMTARQVQVRLHIVMEKMNVEGYFGRNTDIYDYRDLVLQYFSKWHASTAGYPYDFTPFQYTGEQPQYDHDNLYEYVLEFSTNFSQILGNYQDTQLARGQINDIKINKQP